jgi:hypothetical protein
LALTSVGIAASAVSCGGLAQSMGPGAVAVMPGVINRPDNKSLRFAMLKYGLESFCQEMTARGAPLRMSDDQPSIGRFFPQRCDARVIDDDTNKSFLVQFTGSGYAFTNITLRLGFDAAGVVDYDPDFLLDSGTMYLYFRTKHIAATTFQPTMIENPVANLAIITGKDGFAERFGRQVVADELARGFTVIRKGDGSVDFGLGIIEKGTTPVHPYQVSGSDKMVLANERIEVHDGQREFLGPFSVDSEGKALFLNGTVDGAPAIDLLVVQKDVGDEWLTTYIHQRGTTPPRYVPLMDDVASQTTPYRKALPVAKGRYYLVVDNTNTAGHVAPPPSLFGDHAALFSYAVQLGAAP